MTLLPLLLPVALASFILWDPAPRFLARYKGQRNVTLCASPDDDLLPCVDWNEPWSDLYHRQDVWDPSLAYLYAACPGFMLMDGAVWCQHEHPQ